VNEYKVLIKETCSYVIAVEADTPEKAEEVAFNTLDETDGRAGIFSYLTTCDERRVGWVTHLHESVALETAHNKWTSIHGELIKAKPRLLNGRLWWLKENWSGLLVGIAIGALAWLGQNYLG
jgi:hypothetical protein